MGMHAHFSHTHSAWRMVISSNLEFNCSIIYSCRDQKIKEDSEDDLAEREIPQQLLSIPDLPPSLLPPPLGGWKVRVNTEWGWEGFTLWFKSLSGHVTLIEREMVQNKVVIKSRCHVHIWRFQIILKSSLLLLLILHKIHPVVHKGTLCMLYSFFFTFYLKCTVYD